jgi:hypothetical protein
MLTQGPHDFVAFKVFVESEEENEQSYIQNEEILLQKTNAILFAAASTGFSFTFLYYTHRERNRERLSHTTFIHSFVLF